MKTLKTLIIVSFLFFSIPNSFAAESYTQTKQNTSSIRIKQLQKSVNKQQEAIKFQPNIQKKRKKYRDIFNKLKKNIYPPEDEPVVEKNGLISFILGFSSISDGIIIAILFFTTSIFLDPLIALLFFFLLMFFSATAGLITAIISFYRHKKYHKKFKEKNAAIIGMVTAILKLLISVPSLFVIFLMMAGSES